jgi:hypothetical protein
MWLVERLESQEANKNIKADNSQQRCIYAYV